MRVLIACDKFKGSISAIEIAQIFTEELRSIPDVEVVECPLADGGDGTAEILTRTNKGVFKTLEVLDPLFRSRKSSYGWDPKSRTAYIEMALASGIALLSDAELNPLKTSTIGTGELMADAIKSGAEKIILGVGGSATNDGGIGAAQALGYVFLDKDGAPLLPVGENLRHIHRIEKPEVDFPVVEIAVDVNNPFTGEQGASYTYGPQKGADQKMVEELDKGMDHLVGIIRDQLGVDIANVPGAGAAGGLSGGLIAFVNATLRSGIDLVMENVNFDQHLIDADLIVTGEGKVDATSFQGKVVGAVLERAWQNSVNSIIVCGQSDVESEVPVFSLVQAVGTVDESINNPGESLRKLIRQEIIPYLQSH